MTLSINAHKNVTRIQLDTKFFDLWFVLIEISGRSLNFLKCAVFRLWLFRFFRKLMNIQSFTSSLAFSSNLIYYMLMIAAGKQFIFFIIYFCGLNKKYSFCPCGFPKFVFMRLDLLIDLKCWELDFTALTHKI